MQRPYRFFLAATVALSVALAVPAATASASASRSVPSPARAVTARTAALRTGADGVVVVRDVSFPQCHDGLPSGQTAAFAVLGANKGTSFTSNPCLEAQLAWAKRLPAAPAFYANTGNPGPLRARHWPLGQAAPQVCAAADPNSVGCSYDYGWNAARQSLSTAADAAQRLHRVGRANAQQRVANVDWWLDVETMNSWQAHEGHETSAAQRRDVATLTAQIDALRAAGVHRVGVYSTAYQWHVITGGRAVTGNRFAGIPVWLAGFGSRAGAIAGCRASSFTGGPVRMTQYLAKDRFDADVVCNAADVDLDTGAD